MKHLVQPEPKLRKGKLNQTFRIVKDLKVTDDGLTATIVEQGLPHAEAVDRARELNGIHNE